MSAWDILPLQWGKILFFFLLGLGFVAGLEYLYWTRLDWAIQLGVEGLPIFDFGTPGNLSAWFSSGLWFVCAAMCMIAFLIGRKQGQASQLSDIWLWATFGSLLLSADAVCQVKDFLRIVLFKFSGTNLYANGEIWWIVVYVFVFGTIGSRLLIEMRHYLPACNAFFVAALSSLLACCIPLNIVELPFEDARMPVVLRCGLEMTGALFAVLAFSLFVRKMLLACQQGESVPQPATRPAAKEQKPETAPQPSKNSETKPIAAPVLPVKSTVESMGEKAKPLFDVNLKAKNETASPQEEKLPEKPNEKEIVPEKTADPPEDEDDPVIFSIIEEADEKDVKENEKEKEEDKRPARTCQIVHPSANGEKIVKTESIDEYLDEDETKSARKKNSSQKHSQSKTDDTDDDDFDLDEDEQEQLQELLQKLKRKRAKKAG